MKKKTYELDVSGKTLTAEFLDLADQATGSVLLRYGNSAVLATVVMSEYAHPEQHYFPLTVEFEEKFYAAGKIGGNRFQRREGRPSDEAILSARIVDRTIRPLFESHIRNEVQVVISVLSIDADDPDILGVNAASLALATSSIPWNGPVSAVRIGKNATLDNFEINPSYSYRGDVSASCELIACGKDGKINMIEFGGKEIPEQETLDALQFAQKEIEKIQAWQKEIIKEIGAEKQTIPVPEIPPTLQKLFDTEIAPHLKEAVFSGPGKKGIHALHHRWNNSAKEICPDAGAYERESLFDTAVNTLLHDEAIKHGRRPDGRAMNEVRPLFAQAGGLSPILHGSGIFYRGGTHILSVTTLGGPQDKQIIDGIEYAQEQSKRYIHHYNFPPFSVGETGRIGGFNRRMIGHGALAEKALTPVLPSKDTFPYTIRVVSEAMASNGSTSMGSVCGSTLALMDAGVPISAPVAGIASGLMQKSETEYKVLTDIQGPEDNHGDMDFKVAGTAQGITAIQMDVKVDGISLPILKEALAHARDARLTILKTLTAAIASPRQDISPHAPKIVSLSIPPKKIGMIIGSGGKTVNEIREKTETDIEIEDDGTIYITGKGEGPARARSIIEDMTHEFVVGEKTRGIVTRITDFGAFVKISHVAEGLLHVSEIAPFRIERVTDVLSVGEEIPVLIKELDQAGRIKLSLKAIDPDYIKNKKSKQNPESK